MFTKELNRSVSLTPPIEMSYDTLVISLNVFLIKAIDLGESFSATTTNSYGIHYNIISTKINTN